MKDCSLDIKQQSIILNLLILYSSWILIFYAITNLMYLFLRTNSHDDVSVSTPVSTADEMTPRNMPAPHRSQVM